MIAAEVNAKKIDHKAIIHLVIFFIIFAVIFSKKTKPRDEAGWRCTDSASFFINIICFWDTLWAFKTNCGYCLLVTIKIFYNDEYGQLVAAFLSHVGNFVIYREIELFTRLLWTKERWMTLNFSCNNIANNLGLKYNSAIK